MYWKLLIIVIIIVIIIIVYYVKNNNYIEKYIKSDGIKSHANNEEINDFINHCNEGNNKKIYIELDKNAFDKLELIQSKNIYYFPEECPKYTEDYIIKTGVDSIEKFFVPEKKALICVDKDHIWIKNPENFQVWKK